MDSSNTDQPSMDERLDRVFNFGWVFTFAFGFVISQAFPNLAEEAALLIGITPMLLLLIFLAPGKDTEATKDTQ